MPHRLRQCPKCGRGFAGLEGASYCALTHTMSGRQYQPIGDVWVNPDDVPEPDDEPAIVAPRTEPYSVVCVSCTREAGGTLRLTERSAKLRVLAGLGKCPRPFCGGLLVLEPVLMGRPGTFDPTVRTRLDTRQRTPVPRRVA